MKKVLPILILNVTCLISIAIWIGYDVEWILTIFIIVPFIGVLTLLALIPVLIVCRKTVFKGNALALVIATILLSMVEISLSLVAYLLFVKHMVL
ncbi:MAG: hypothetical protein JST70_18555 [Bacteroidetes bacterium]|nr:hypothetical protein [Bacteroidota bacterium]